MSRSPGKRKATPTTSPVDGEGTPSLRLGPSAFDVPAPAPAGVDGPGGPPRA